MGLHFLAFWPCGPSFPCILALWAFISFHFGLFGVSFWAPPPHVAKSRPFAQRPYNGFISAFGLHFPAFWPCGPLFPFILAFSGSASGPPPQVAKNSPLAQRPYNGFISAVTGSILQFLAFWAFISLHFGLVGFHFLAFWPCGPSFPCILAVWAFTSFHFGLFGVGFRAPPPTSCQNWSVCPTSLQWIYQRRNRRHFAVFSLLGLHFLAFWPCGPLFPCILALGPTPQVAKNGPFAQRPYNRFISALTAPFCSF